METINNSLFLRVKTKPMEKLTGIWKGVSKLWKKLLREIISWHKQGVC